MENKYDKYPPRSTVRFFKNAIGNHTKVTSIEEISDYFYKIERKNLPDLKVVLSNIYILGEADVHELMAEYQGVNCILVGGNWNCYSDDAKLTAKYYRVGLFQFGEFFGAINYAGNQFLNYDPTLSNKEKRRRRNS